jgi:hypothetical protein
VQEQGQGQGQEQEKGQVWEQAEKQTPVQR